MRENKGDSALRKGLGYQVHPLLITAHNRTNNTFYCGGSLKELRFEQGSSEPQTPGCISGFWKFREEAMWMRGVVWQFLAGQGGRAE